MPDRGRRSLTWFLSRIIVGQQLSTAAASTIWGRVESTIKSYESSIPDFFVEKHSGLLRQCGVSQAKIRALIAIREAHEQGVLSVKRLRGMNHAERSECLQNIWGIGQWTADMVSIFFFGDLDVWPESDVGVYRGLESIVGRQSKKTILKIARSFSPYQSFLALYMWKILDAPKETGTKSLHKKRPV